MNLAIDDIKIRYSSEGYLPNYPPHLISNEEMCDAFINNDIAFFYDRYTLENPDLYLEYQKLIAAIKYHIDIFLDTDSKNWVDLPNWVYSYMLGHVVNKTSLQQDRHYLLVGLGVDNIDDNITSESQLACYKMSEGYVKSLPKKYKKEIQFSYIDPVTKDEVVARTTIRPPTMFGESHIIKKIRMLSLDYWIYEEDKD